MHDNKQERKKLNILKILAHLQCILYQIMVFLTFILPVLAVDGRESVSRSVMSDSL